MEARSTTTMTRKHFNAIADALRFSRPIDEDGTGVGNDHYEQGRMDQWQADYRAMADAYRSFNGQFDRDRFLRACAGTE